MSAAIYLYRKNWNGSKEPVKRPYLTKAKVRFVDFFRKGFQHVHRYDEDFFVSICQYLMQKGFPKTVTLSYRKSSVIDFLQEALFSICPFESENLYINYRKFIRGEWRKQFDIFNEMELKGLNPFYRHRAAMPIKPFTSFEDIKNEFLKVEKTPERFLGKPNSHWIEANVIKGKWFTICKNRIYYVLNYGFDDDHNSSWEINICSDENENFVDFCLRVKENYKAILLLDETVFQKEDYCPCYYFKPQMESDASNN